MKHISLAAKYRPQKFSEVVGQQMATAALSRAAKEDRVAPAYLLSGTRGVGKTTIARIFAKALNCEHSPAAEPCNECIQCTQITAGNHVDVLEIDGASNTGVDDVRALRENVGYMPMQGRYKIFIMDEAHMLSKSAFNALLKTLEEPPGHTVFIFATTEAHRFPATIVSRCQHFVFQHQPEEILLQHLLRVLEKEGVPHDPGAIRLIARRAAGSVRDSLSLLDQTLALSGSKELNNEIVRQSLGLAGLEFFESLFKAIPAKACSEIVKLCGSLLHNGVDIGFFIRELASTWRNLFLFRQEGDKILPHLDLAPDESAFMKRVAPAFTPAHLHAAWQMTLENQKSIAQNPEPGPALELLLLNLALLPQLMPIGKLPNTAASEPPMDEEAQAARQPQSPALDETPKDYGPTEKLIPPLANTEIPSPTTTAPSGYEQDRWKEFLNFCTTSKELVGDLPADVLRGLSASWQDNALHLSFKSELAANRFAKKRQSFEKALQAFCGTKLPDLRIETSSASALDRESLIKECKDMPQVQLCMEILGGNVADCRPKIQET